MGLWEREWGYGSDGVVREGMGWWGGWGCRRGDGAVGE